MKTCNSIALCLGNNNKYESKEECEAVCVEETELSQYLVDKCEQPIKPGPCAGNFSRWKILIQFFETFWVYLWDIMEAFLWNVKKVQKDILEEFFGIQFWLVFWTYDIDNLVQLSYCTYGTSISPVLLLRTLFLLYIVLFPGNLFPLTLYCNSRTTVICHCPLHNHYV